MERHEVLDMMRTLRLSGMRAVFDEIVAAAIKRGHPIQRVIGELLRAEIADKKARSIKYQMTIAKLPSVKELADFDFVLQPGQRTVGAGSGHRRVPGRQAQPRAGRRHG